MAHTRCAWSFVRLERVDLRFSRVKVFVEFVSLLSEFDDACLSPLELRLQRVIGNLRQLVCCSSGLELNLFGG